MPDETTVGPRHTKRVRRFPDDEIGITLGGVEYIMPVAEANDLVGLINAARHTEPLNWAGTAPEAETNGR